MCYNADDMKGITTTQSSFKEFIELDALYVDKTMYAYSLVKDPRRNFFFLSRPRRYGKSLFCSTLHALFDGRRDLFEGLYIAERTDYSFERYPVLHFDFSPLDMTDMESFLSCFRLALRRQAREHGVTIDDGSPAAMLTELLDAVIAKEGKKAVIIIDEFDSPMTSAMDKGFNGSVRDVFSAFYAVIKMNAPRIRLFFITGVVKLSNLSIFSKMNNLVDLSMDPRFASAFGYTDEELLEYFGEGIDEYYSSHKDEYSSRDEFVSRIREYYDGYRFSPDSDVTVYNPVSIGYFFDEECRFRCYWNMTGVPTLAVNLASRFPLADILGYDLSLPLTAFTTFDISQICGGDLSEDSILALMYYTGYLTIRDGNENGVTLRFPNREVSSSFTEFLVSRHATKGIGALVYKGSVAMTHGDVEGLVDILNSYLSLFSYQLVEKEGERTFHMLIHAYMVCLGSYAYPEDPGYKGRADEVVRYGSYIYIFELKRGDGAEAALRQIKDKGYADKYLAEARHGGKHIIICGLDISSSEGKVVDYRYEEVI